MTELHQIYKCNVCGNMVEIVQPGQGQLVCCGQEMALFVPKTEDVGTEKHLPVVEKNGNQYTIKVGAVNHPMEEKHYIQWIELLTKTGIQRKYLKPQDTPQATFCTDEDVEAAREYCNLHGLWQTKNE